MNHTQTSTLMKKPFITVHSAITSELCQAIIDGFYRCHDLPAIRRSHLFNGRYENIYLDESHIPALKQLIEEARGHARDILGIKHLRTGYWFNHMAHGAVTSKHSHDDNDELLSAVFYLQAPPESGDLIIHCNNHQHSITPVTGRYVFFKPDVMHEVSTNNSGQDRLSLALNFGHAATDKQTISEDEQTVAGGDVYNAD